LSLRFSIVIPVYNRENFISKAIDSALSQTFANFEVIVVDDGSKDGTPAILASYGNRIKIIRQENQGPEVARNAGAAAAQGEYIALLDSDDFLLPSALAIYDRIIETFNSPPLVIGAEVFLKDDQAVPSQALHPSSVQVLKFKDYLSKTVPVTSIGSKFLIRKQVWNEVGGFRHSTAKTWYGDVFDFLLKLGVYEPFVLVKEPSTVVRYVHDENSVWNAEPHAKGLLGVAQNEREGQYPGGPARRWDRYAMIGGPIAQWAYLYCWRRGQRKLAIRMLLAAAPMVTAAFISQFLRPLRKRPEQIELPLD
jgi:glycosyltransferase involved in cell wall biosynthesis